MRGIWQMPCRAMDGFTEECWAKRLDKATFRPNDIWLKASSHPAAAGGFLFYWLLSSPGRAVQNKQEKHQQDIFVFFHQGALSTKQTIKHQQDIFVCLCSSTRALSTPQTVRTKTDKIFGLGSQWEEVFPTDTNVIADQTNRQTGRKTDRQTGTNTVFLSQKDAQSQWEASDHKQTHRNTNRPKIEM